MFKLGEINRNVSSISDGCCVYETARDREQIAVKCTVTRQTPKQVMAGGPRGVWKRYDGG